MPDDLDYQALDELLREPERWTQADERTVRSMLRQQREMVASAHAKDRRGRARLQAVVDAMQAAVERFEASR